MNNNNLKHKIRKTLFKTLFYISVGFHFLLVITNILAFMVLPFCSRFIQIPFWLFVLIITPIETFIFRLVFVSGECPITDCENKLRQTLGMKRISSFVGHYFIKPFRKKKNVSN